MRLRGARTLTITANDALTKARKLGGPLRVVGWCFTGGGAGSSQTVDQSAAAPGAGGTIASISLANGAYQVEWTLELSGTLAAADADNVQLFIGGTLVATSVNGGVANTYPQEEANPAVSGGPLLLAWKAIGASTVGSVYKIEANIISLTQGQGTVFDGGQSIIFLSMAPQGTDKEWLDLEGIAVDTELAVQTTVGSINGVIWYYLQSDLDARNQPDHYGG